MNRDLHSYTKDKVDSEIRDKIGDEGDNEHNHLIFDSSGCTNLRLISSTIITQVIISIGISYP